MFSGGIGAGIAGGAARLVADPLRHSLEHAAPKVSRHIGLVTPLAAAAGAVMGVREKKLQMNMAADPQKRKEYMRVTGSGQVTVPKIGGMDASCDTDQSISGRASTGQFSEGAELANVGNIQGFLEAAFAQKDRMRQQVAKQLGAAFPQAAAKGYGRARAVGIPARDASDRVLRALSAAPKEPVNR